MTVPYQRRRDPPPLTQGWEVAAGLIGLGLIGVALAALAGLGVAAAVFGGGWLWPHGVDAIGRTLGALAAGHPGRGLPPTLAGRVAGPVATYSCVVVCELAVIVGSVTAGVAIARRLRSDGMATRRDAEQVLGLSELRSARGIIRPDLHSRAGADSRPTRPVLGWGRKGNS